MDEEINHNEYYDLKSYKLYPEKRKKNTKNYNKCITDCQLPGRTITHPLNNLRITEFDGPFCATENWYDNRDKKIKYHDVCNYSEIDLLAWSAMDTTKFIPLNNSKCEMLLSRMHNINNIKDAIEWANTTTYDENIRKRILSCAWKVYQLVDEESPKLKNEICIQFQKLAKEYWFDTIYLGLNKFFDERISEKDVKQHINYLISDTSLIKLFLTTYIKLHRKDWLTLNFDKEDIKLHFINELKTLL